MTATQRHALQYATRWLGGDGPHSLSMAVLKECALGAGVFRWTVEPVLGEDGEWYDGGQPLISEWFGRRAFLNIVENLVPGRARAALEWAMVTPSRDRSQTPASYPGIRRVFNETQRGIETFVLLDPSADETSIDLAHGIVGGAYREVGVVTRAPAQEFPPDGTDVTNEQIESWALAATHVFFRGPSYEGYVVWTAPGADPPEL